MGMFSCAKWTEWNLDPTKISRYTVIWQLATVLTLLLPKTTTYTTLSAVNSKQPKKVQLIPHFEILIGASQDPAQLIVWTPDPSGHAVRRVWGPEYSINMSRIRFKSSHLVQCLRKGPLKKHRRLAKAIVITCDLHVITCLCHSHSVVLGSKFNFYACANILNWQVPKNGDSRWLLWDVSVRSSSTWRCVFWSHHIVSD